MTSAFSRLTLLGLVACSSPDSQFTKLYPDITVAPDAIDFGQVVKLYSVATELQILNAGRAPLDITSIALINEVHAEDGASIVIEGDPVELGPDGVLTVTVNFAPIEYLSYSADLVIESNDEINPIITIPINGSGIVGSTPDIDIDPQSVTFVLPPVTGESTSGHFTISNNGDGPLTILDMIQTGPDVYTLVTDAVGEVIPEGSEKLVVVEYTSNDPLASGHTGILIVQSTDPDEPEVPVVLIGGDGGGGYQFPVAIIDCESIGTVYPPEVIIVDGMDSYDPKDVEEDDPLTYAWTLTSKPDHSQSTIEYPSDPAFEFPVDLAGNYAMQLVVTDSNGISSDPAACVVQAIPSEELYVVLSWNKDQSDVDLHLVPEDTDTVNCKFFGCCDCFYANQSPSNWSDLGFGSCVYALDNRSGYGPENVNVEDPDDREYHIRVHYWDDFGADEVKATVQVYLNRDPEPIAIITQDLTYNDKWKVGYVDFVDGVGAFVTGDDPPATSGTRSYDSECTAP